MRVIGAAELEAVLGFDLLIERLRKMFRTGCEAPVRHHHTVPTLGQHAATLLLMPAWQVGRHIGVKIVTVFPENGEKSLPAVMGAYMLLDRRTGTPLALTRGERAGRRFYDQITLFKSVGTALEDLAAAQLAAELV